MKERTEERERLALRNKVKEEKHYQREIHGGLREDDIGMKNVPARPNGLREKI